MISFDALNLVTDLAEAKRQHTRTVIVAEVSFDTSLEAEAAAVVRRTSATFEAARGKLLEYIEALEAKCGSGRK